MSPAGSIRHFKHRARRQENDRRLADAMDRLIADQSTKTDGSLTAANVAKEAGLGRASLYRPGRESLLARWSELLAAKKAASGSKAVNPVEHAKRELRDLRRSSSRRIAELTSLNQLLARQVQHLTLELNSVTHNLQRSALGNAARVTPIARAKRPGVRSHSEKTRATDRRQRKPSHDAIKNG